MKLLTFLKALGEHLGGSREPRTQPKPGARLSQPQRLRRIGSNREFQTAPDTGTLRLRQPRSSAEDEPHSSVSRLDAVLAAWWFRGLWWGLLAALILLFCGQSSKFIYIDF